MQNVSRVYKSYEQAMSDETLPAEVKALVEGRWPTTADGHRVEAEDVVLADVRVDAGCEQADGDTYVWLTQPVLVDTVNIYADVRVDGIEVGFTVSGSTRGGLLRNKPAFMAEEPAYGWRLAR